MIDLEEGNLVFLIRVKDPDPYELQLDPQGAIAKLDDLAKLFTELYRQFGPFNPEATYIWITGSDNYEDLYLGIIEVIPKTEEDEPEEQPEGHTPGELLERIPADQPTKPGSGFVEDDLA